MFAIAGCHMNVGSQLLIEQKLESLIQNGENREVISLYKKSKNRLRENAKLCYIMTQAHYGLDKYEECRAFAKKTLELEPTKEYAARFFASVSKHSGDLNDSIEFLDDMLSKNPKWALAYKDYSILLDHHGLQDEAYKVAKEGYTRLPDNTHLASTYFYMSLQSLPTEEVLPEIDAWIDEHDPDTFFISQIGKGLSDAGSYKHALTYLFQAIEKGTTDRAVFSEIYDCYRGLGDYESALEFNKIHNTDKNSNPVLWNMLGTIAYDTEHYNDALDHFNIALGIDKSSIKYAANKIFTLYELERSSEAIAFAKSWFHEHEQKTTDRFHYACGHAYFAKSRMVEALEHYHKALSLSPSTSKYAREIVTCLMELNRFTEAASFGQEWLLAYPNAANQSFLEKLEEAKEYN